MLLLENAARTLAKCTGDTEYGALSPQDQVKLKEAARGMLLAARKPSAEMMRAAQTIELPNGYRLTALEAMLVWERMIDAAVSERQPTSQLH